MSMKKMRRKFNIDKKYMLIIKTYSQVCLRKMSYHVNSMYDLDDLVNEGIIVFIRVRNIYDVNHSGTFESYFRTSLKNELGKIVSMSYRKYDKCVINKHEPSHESISIRKVDFEKLVDNSLLSKESIGILQLIFSWPDEYVKDCADIYNSDFKVIWKNVSKKLNLSSSKLRAAKKELMSIFA